MYTHRDGQPMKLLKQFEENRNLSNAKQKTYKNVTFVNGFANFLESLVQEKLIINQSKRELIDNKHRWCDDVRVGGITFETTEHPLVNENEAGDVIITGSKDAFDLIDKIFETHEVEYQGKTSPRDIKLRYQYHDDLNPAVWSGFTIHPKVREKLIEAGEAFFESLNLPDLEIEDVIFTGSNANYNWTQDSDIDLHIVVDFKKAKEQYGEIVEELFKAKKSVFNDLHDIRVGPHQIEFYVQDSAEKHVSTGVFSIQDNKWIEKPVYKEPSVDDSAVKAKTAELMNSIDQITKNCNKASAVEKLMEKIKKMRQAGLDEAGEFSVENLAFKQLRYNGYLEKLATCKTKAFDRALSVEEEEWTSLY